MLAAYGRVINLATLGLAVVAAAFGAVRLVSERPSEAIVYFAIAAGTWAFGRAVMLALGAKPASAKK